jgi:3-deoxy-D-manno-octulosonate 8-phosphate phosphatase (KDO 8-P phosphatase)
LIRLHPSVFPDDKEPFLRHVKISMILTFLMQNRPQKLNLPFSPELIAFDFDGVFTNNRVFVDENGIESVICNRSDGLAIEYLRDKYPLVVLSTEKNGVVTRRARKLGIGVYQGLADKHETLVKLCNERYINIANVVFIGNDINDLGAIEVCGFALAPSDAHPRVLEEVHHVLSTRGGDGVIREFCEIFFGM